MLMKSVSLFDGLDGGFIKILNKHTSCCLLYIQPKIKHTRLNPPVRCRSVITTESWVQLVPHAEGAD